MSEQQLSPMWRALVGAMVRIQLRGNGKTTSVSTPVVPRESKEANASGRPTSS